MLSIFYITLYLKTFDVCTSILYEFIRLTVGIIWKLFIVC